MKVRIGCDIVEIERFTKLEDAVLDRIFHPNERLNPKAETLAGIFAVKESCKKVFNQLTWHDIEVTHAPNGKPHLILAGQDGITQYDISISHDGGYAMAAVIFMVK